MKLKNAFWTLAVALAVVSCSDELDENGGGSTITTEDGEGVYLTVNIATPTGAATKANPDGSEPTYGEDGDGNLEGVNNESDVYDINLYLIKASETSVTNAINNQNDGITVASTTNESGSYPKIVGHGYTDQISGNSATINQHSQAYSVKIEVDAGALTNTPQVFHVFAVANLGKSVTFDNLDALRDAVGSSTESTAWNGSAWEGNDASFGKPESFVMSTHQMYDVAGGSSVELSTTNSNPDQAASTTVYIERLAARIDMNIVAGLLDGTATVKKPITIEGTIESNADSEEETEGDYITINGYQIINRWNGDNYMLKRVNDVNQSGTEYPAISLSGTINYLGDETYTTTGTAKYGYVLDPETAQDKKTTADGYATIKQNYISHYDAILNDPVYSNNTGFTSVSSTSFTEDVFSPILYTKENCLDLNDQVYGLMTGVIFRGIYKPSGVSSFTTTGGNGSDVGVEVAEYTDGDNFYVIRDYVNKSGSQYLCADLKTIGALSFANVSVTEVEHIADIIKALFDESTNTWGSATIDELKSAVEGIQGGSINKAYQTWLQEKLTDATTLPDVSTMTWSAFLTNKNISDPGAESGSVKYAETLLNDYNIAFYKGGTNYYPFFIRHANNGNDALVGPMEYCIVRNNVYQLAVTAVNGLGEPLPFVDPEDTPGESKEAYLTVAIYVKDWVKRSNPGIIL